MRARSELLEVDFGGPLHCLVICGTTHPLEEELLKWHMKDAQSGGEDGAKESSVKESLAKDVQGRADASSETIDSAR